MNLMKPFFKNEPSTDDEQPQGYVIFTANAIKLVLVLILLSTFFLAACTSAAPPASSGNNNSAPTNAPADEEPTPTREGDTGIAPGSNEVVGFTAEISGSGFETQIVGEGSLACSDGQVQVTNNNLQSIIVLRLPPDAAPGTLTIGENDVSAIAQFDDINQYTQNAQGTITLDALAAAAGEDSSGSFDFTVENGEGDTLTVSGSFDFAATEGTTFCA